MGLSDELFSYPLAAGETFTVPEVIMSYSAADGFSTTPASVSMCFTSVRPVLINLHQ